MRLSSEYAMSFWRKIEKRREEDDEMEQTVGVQKNDPLATKIGRTYTPADIERLEEERVPWLRKRRRR